MLIKNLGMGFIVFFMLILISCNTQTEKKIASEYIPDSKEFYNNIVHMDSVLFGA